MCAFMLHMWTCFCISQLSWHLLANVFVGFCEHNWHCQILGPSELFIKTLLLYLVAIQSLNLAIASLQLSDEDSKELLSIKNAAAINVIVTLNFSWWKKLLSHFIFMMEMQNFQSITGDIIYRILEKIGPEDDFYDIGNKLKVWL